MVMDILFIRSAMVLISSAVICTQAFWWSTPSTESPPILKQIPVGYFRTYTYHPLTYPGAYSSYSYMGSHHQSVASPFFGWTERQTPSISNPSPGLSGLHIPAAVPPNISPTQPQYPTLFPTRSPQTLTTSTTTTTPVNQMQNHGNSRIPTTSHPHPVETQSPPVENKQQQQQQQQQQDNSGSSRPKYSLPDPIYPQYQYPSPSPSQQVQFVPCMCPVSVTVSEIADSRSFATEDFDEHNDLLSSRDDIH